MTMIDIVSALDSLAHQHPALALIVELGLKSFLVLICGFIAVWLLAKASASSKNFAWRMVFSILFALPFLQGLIPDMQIAVHSSHPENASLISGTFSNPALQSVLYSTLFLGYFLVSAFLLLRLVVSLYRSSLIVRSASAIESARIHSLLNKAVSRNGSTHPISLLVSDFVTSPVTMGVITHKIIFPSAVHSWSDNLVEQVIGHELGHIQRSDWVQQFVGRLVVCFFWFNPLALIAANRMSLEAEKASDDFAIDDTGCRISYAENLLGLAQLLKQKTNGSLALGFFGGQHVLLQRIAYILSEDKHQHRIDRDSCLPGVLVAVLLAMPISAANVTLEQPSLAATTKPLLFAVDYFPNKSAESTLFQRELESHSTHF